MEMKKIDSKASALLFVASRIDDSLEPYRDRQVAQSIRSKINNLANVFNGLATMASYKDPLQTAESHFIKVSSQAKRLLDNTTAETNQLFEHYRTYYLQLDKELLSATGLTNPPLLGNEIRPALKEMSSEERSNKLSSSIKNSEFDVLGSIYHAPAFLSGLTEGEKEAHFNIYFAKHAPEPLKERKNLEEVFSSVNTFMRSYRNALSSFTDPKKMREIEKAKELSDIAQSQLIGALNASV